MRLFTVHQWPVLWAFEGDDGDGKEDEGKEIAYA